MIWSLIISVIFIGIGSGLMFIGSLDFELNDGKELMITQSMETDMYDNLVINNLINNKVEYIESNNKNIKIEYLLNKHSTASYEIYDNSKYKELYIHSKNIEVFKMMKESINYINNKKLLSQNNQLSEIKIYTTKENIDTLKANNAEWNDNSNNISNYQAEIQNLNNKIAEYQATINVLNYELDTYRSQNN